MSAASTNCSARSRAQLRGDEGIAAQREEVLVTSDVRHA